MWKALKQLTYQDLQKLIRRYFVGYLRILLSGLGLWLIIYLGLVLKPDSRISLYLQLLPYNNYSLPLRLLFCIFILFSVIFLVSGVVGFIRLLKETIIKYDSIYAEEYKHKFLMSESVGILEFLTCIENKKDGILNDAEFEIKRIHFINDTNANLFDLYGLISIKEYGNNLLSADEFNKKKELALANLDNCAFGINTKYNFMDVLSRLKDDGFITDDEFILKKKQYKSNLNQELVKILVFCLKIIVPGIIMLFLLQYFKAYL